MVIVCTNLKRTVVTVEIGIARQWQMHNHPSNHLDVINPKVDTLPSNNQMAGNIGAAEFERTTTHAAGSVRGGNGGRCNLYGGGGSLGLFRRWTCNTWEEELGSILFDLLN